MLRAVLGPRADFVTDPAELTGTTWTASSRSDRIGMRLEGGRLRRVDDAEVPSEGMVRGAIQVPPGGEPVVFLADHPVTGGYPVVATVCDADVDRAAQVRPGQGVRFVVVPPAWKDTDRATVRQQLVDLDRGKWLTGGDQRQSGTRSGDFGAARG